MSAKSKAACSRRLFINALLWSAGLVGAAMSLRPGSALIRGPKTKLVAKYYDIKECNDNDTLHYFRIYNVTVRMNEDGANVVDAYGAIEVAVETMKQLTVIVSRCTGGISSNTCEYYNRLSWSMGLCGLVVARGMVWTPFVDKVTPPFQCPLPAGEHHVINATLDMGMMEGPAMRLILTNSIWRLHTQMLNEKNQVFVCFDGTFEVQRVLIKTQTHHP